MYTIYNFEGDTIHGTLDETQFRFLMDRLQEESEDTDLYINQATVDMLEQDGADVVLLTLLRRALGNSDDTDIRWVRS